MNSGVGGGQNRGARRYVPAEVRFWALVEKGPGCWLWKGYINIETGYGHFRAPEGVMPAQRFSLELSLGEELGDRDACHDCDNPPCVRPEHLFPGTRSENVMDAYAKGRWCGNRKIERAISAADLRRR